MNRPGTYDLHEFHERHAKKDLYRFAYFTETLDRKSILLSIEAKSKKCWMPNALLEMPLDFYNSLPKEAFDGGFIMADALYPLYIKNQDSIPSKPQRHRK